jgi:hypothetical protein
MARRWICEGLRGARRERFRGILPNGFADSGDAEREKRSQRLDEIQREVTLDLRVVHGRKARLEIEEISP